MAVLDTRAGNLVIKDIPHAIIKDPRSIFSNESSDDDAKEGITELHLLLHYANIVGSNELNLRNQCVPMLQNDLKTWKNNVLSADEESVKLCEQMFQQSIIEIMHISHYSIEFVLNLTNTDFIDEMEYKTDVSPNNYYLVGAYQQTEYSKHMDELLTIGITTSISYSQNTILYNFYVDDFIQDLFKILSNTEWYDNTCKLSDKLFYEIAQFCTDCLHSIPYVHDNNAEILLNNGQLHVFLAGHLKSQNNAMIANTEQVLDDRLEIIAQTLADLGRQIHTQYISHRNFQKIKSEYDKWKKQSLRKRQNLKPKNMDELTEKLKFQQRARYLAQDSIFDINKLKHLYFMNPVFRLKFKPAGKTRINHPKSKTANLSALKNLFSFGNSIKKKKHMHEAAMSYNPALDFLASADHPSFHSNLGIKQKHKRASKSMQIDRSYTEPLNANKKKRYRKSGVGSSSVLSGVKLFGPSQMSRSKSHDPPDKSEKKQNGQVEINAIMKTKSADVDTDDDDDGYARLESLDELGHSNLSDKNGFMFSNSYSMGSEKVGRKGHRRQVSMTEIKVKNQIKSAYKDYEKDKGYLPSDIQAFVLYCKKRKNIKKANWTFCKEVMDEMK